MRVIKILLILALILPAAPPPLRRPPPGGAPRTGSIPSTSGPGRGICRCTIRSLKPPQRVPITEEIARQHPGLILLDENVTFPDAGYVVAPGGLPSGPTVGVVMTDPAYFSPVPTAGGGANLTSLPPPLREYDLVIADPVSFVADAGSGSPVALHLPRPEVRARPRTGAGPRCRKRPCVRQERVGHV
ncbi:hypothetical protein [Methanoculleus chikugoensis]|uniref:hypothetical protein n=1 Tax=Methanoculleus chikugoensis TaxID=118126 RepID=UPI001FB1B740|nr:hypothetical protein [Methanoculleus chikugoensis]